MTMAASRGHLTAIRDLPRWFPTKLSQWRGVELGSLNDCRIHLTTSGIHKAKKGCNVRRDSENRCLPFLSHGYSVPNGRRKSRTTYKQTIKGNIKRNGNVLWFLAGPQQPNLGRRATKLFYASLQLLFICRIKEVFANEFVLT